MSIVICFKCSPATKTKLDNLLLNGAFADYSEVIGTAIDNLTILHEEVQSYGSIVLGGEGRRKRPEIAVNATRRTSSPGQKAAVHQSFEVSETDAIPALFTLGQTSEAPSKLAPPPGDVFFPGQPVPIDRWIFGQYGRLLPAKASCRAVARMYPPPANGFELDKVAARIAQEAEALGQYLAERDRERGLNRDDAWAVGFPSGDDKADRSRLRYANQFVGAIGKQGRVTGLLIDLKLINLAKNGSKRILLTRAGWDFAVLANPVLDAVSADGKFSPGEVTFLLQHIQEHVPSEDFAFRTILDAIRGGDDTPDKLDESCKRHVPPKRRDEITKAVITTQRTGVVARMIDLGLISRCRNGVRMSYAVTELGGQYADRTVAG